MSQIRTQKNFQVVGEVAEKFTLTLTGGQTTKGGVHNVTARIEYGPLHQRKSKALGNISGSKNGCETSEVVSSLTPENLQCGVRVFEAMLKLNLRESWKAHIKKIP